MIKVMTVNDHMWYSDDLIAGTQSKECGLFDIDIFHVIRGNALARIAIFAQFCYTRGIKHAGRRR